jgi:hypothetical protein
MQSRSEGKEGLRGGGFFRAEFRRATFDEAWGRAPPQAREVSGGEVNE